MKPIILKPYQKECLKTLKTSHEEGRGLLVMASGLGKTIVSAEDAKDFLKDHPGRLLYLCHSRYILEHAEQEFKRVFDENLYTYGANYKGDTEQKVDFYFATLKTMSSRLHDYEKNEFVYIIFDEGHHAPAKTYKQVIEYFEPQYLLGLTATPRRLDGKDIGDQFGGTLVNLDLPAALAEGLLTPVDYRVMLDDLSEEALNETLNSSERYSINDLNRRLFIPKRDAEIRDLIREKLQEVDRPKVLIFCQTIQHAKRTAKLLDATVVHSRMQNSHIAAILERFQRGEISMLVSVDMLNEGIDTPDANTIVFLRSTVSSRIFYQQLGRGLRTAPGKGKVLVLDFIGTCERLEILENLEIATRESATRHGKNDAEGIEISIGTTKFRERHVDILSVINQARANWSKQFLTDEELLLGLRNFAEVHGRSPVTREAGACPEIYAQAGVYRKRFGSWDHALILAGLEPSHTEYTDEELRENIASILAKIGHLPSSHEIKKYGAAISAAPYFDRWGTLKAAYQALGFNGEYRSRRNYSQSTLERASMLDYLRQIYQRTGRIPTSKDLDTEDALYGRSAYAQVFGSMRAALTEAFPDQELRPYRNRYSVKDDEAARAQVIAFLKQKGAEIGGVPTVRSLYENGGAEELPGEYKIRHLFGSWANALTAAGFDVERRTFWHGTAEEAIEILKDFYANLPAGVAPTRREYTKYCSSRDQREAPRYYALNKLFGTWNNALIAAGIEPVMLKNSKTAKN